MKKWFYPFIYFISFLLLINLVLIQQSEASATRLSPISGGDLRAPFNLALDEEGNIYVTEPSENRLLIYGRDGTYLRDIKGLNKPLGVAVDGSGRIYIGSGDKGSVSVYNPDLTLSHKLGSGDGEFIKPLSIAINGSGDIYVVDSKANTVKVYNDDGALIFSFGSPGSEAGKFNSPTSIAIDDTTGEVIVSDLQVINTNNGLTAGARIQVFDKSGVFKRSFGTYGIGAGKIARPMGLAVDSSGNIYVSDSYQNVVQIFDPFGNYIETLYDLTYPMSTPMGIVVGKDRRVFIASLNGYRIEVYGLSGYTTMDVSPTSLSFEAEEGGINPSSQNVTISNGGEGILNWSVVSDNVWIVPGQNIGSTGPSSSSILSTGVNITGLKAGIYTGSITIIAESGASDTVTINLTIAPPPKFLSVTPSFPLTFPLTFKAQKNGANPESQAININNLGSGEMSWSGSTDQPWLSINTSSGIAPSTVSVSVNTSSLDIGTYTGSVTITAEGAQGSPATVSVSLEIISAGDIYVTTNLSSATFTVTGPATYSGSGMSYTIEDATSGEYTITYGEVTGYRKPSSEKKTLISGSSITFTGDYIDLDLLASKRAIITGQGPGPGNNALVKIWNRDGQFLSQFMASNLSYGVNVASGDINGDGIDDIITGAGPGSKNPALLRVFERDGSLITELYPFSNLYGLNVASGDIDGDGKAEIVVGAGPGSKNPARVRVFSFDSTSGKLVDTGTNFYAYSYTYGVKVAAGDIDGDGLSEIITAPGPGPKNPSLIKIWKVDTSGGTGYWKVNEAGSLAAFGYKYGANISTGDVDGDDVAEIIVGAGPDPNAPSRVKVIKANGAVFTEFIADGTIYGLNVASADLDGDGLSDVITGSGPGFENRATVRVIKATGEPIGIVFDAYSTYYGVNVSVGQILD